MPVATLRVAYVNPPKNADMKKGSIKTEGGDYFGVWKDKLDSYVVGGEYEVEYETNEYNGKTYRTVKRIISAKEPDVSAGNPGGSGGAPSSTKSVEMAIMGIVGRAYEGTAGVPDEETLLHQMRAVKNAWEKCFSPDVDTPKPDLPQDEIPF